MSRIHLPAFGCSQLIAIAAPITVKLICIPEREGFLLKMNRKFSGLFIAKKSKWRTKQFSLMDSPNKNKVFLIFYEEISFIGLILGGTQEKNLSCFYFITISSTFFLFFNPNCLATQQLDYSKGTFSKLFLNPNLIFYFVSQVINLAHLKVSSHIVLAKNCNN